MNEETEQGIERLGGVL